MAHRNPVMRLAFLISLLFHLSMVTLFQIVIFFPRNDVDYFIFRIIDPRTQEAQAATLGERLRVPSADEAFKRFDSGTENSALYNDLSSLPEIELPTLEFATLDRLRLRSEGLDIRSQYGDLFQDERQDTWTRFGRKLGSIGGVLSGRNRSDTTGEAMQPFLVSRPAPGFEAYLIWLNGAQDREPISVAKIDVLWGVDPSHLEQSITLVFKVDREGKVAEVIVPTEDEFGFVDGAAQALLKYRFNSIGQDGPDLQHGTLVIGAAGKQP